MDREKRRTGAWACEGRKVEGSLTGWLARQGTRAVWLWREGGTGRKGGWVGPARSGGTFRFAGSRCLGKQEVATRWSELWVFGLGSVSALVTTQSSGYLTGSWLWAGSIGRKGGGERGKLLLSLTLANGRQQ